MAEPAPTTPGKLTPWDVQAQALAMLASGATISAVADTIGVSRKSLTRWLNKSERANWRLVTALRSAQKVMVAKAIQQRITGKALKRLDESLDSGDAKEVDALSRSLLNIEKVAASVAGENAKGGTGGGGSVTLKVLMPDWAQPQPERVVIEHPPLQETSASLEVLEESEQLTPYLEGDDEDEEVVREQDPVG